MRSKVQILDAVNQEIRVIYIRRRWSIGALGEIICLLGHFRDKALKRILDYIYFGN